MLMLAISHFISTIAFDFFKPFINQLIYEFEVLGFLPSIRGSLKAAVLTG